MSGRPPICWPSVTVLPDARSILQRQHNVLAFVAFLWQTIPMKEQGKVILALRGQFDADYKALKDVQREQERLRASYNRFCELTAEAHTRTERIRRLMIMLWMHEPGTVNKTISDKAFELGIALPEGWETIAVWEAVLEIVRQFPNTQMVDLVQWLEKEIQIDATRQSVDSALASHPELFDVRRVGKGKYISLRKDEHAPATTRKRK
jgi:hypothetical protein